MKTNQLDQPISGMTIRELKALIADEVRAQMSEPIELELQGYLLEPDPIQAAEALKWLRDHRWTPPPDAPSTLEIIRRDRDR